MNSIETLTEFIGWCTLINIGFLLVTSILILLMRTAVSNIHSKMFGLDSQDVLKAYFHYLANYKIAIIIFNLAPYFALKIMGS